MLSTDLDWIASRCVSALLLEVSTTPKPGLVDRYHDFKETLFEHFLLSSSTLYSCFRNAAEAGYKRRGRGLGKVIYEGARNMMLYQKGGNTHLGALLLISPIAAASSLSETKPVKLKTLKKNLKIILSGMDWRDTVHIFNAVRLVSPRGLGRIPFMDVLKNETYIEIRKNKLKPLNALSPFIDREIVAYEWVRMYPRTIYGTMKLIRNIRKMPMREALAQTFLELLSKYPDTHILRRGGKPLANQISYMASRILSFGGVSTRRGLEALYELDRKMRRSWRIRPGATADLLASSIAVTLLMGWVP
ncbi:MAG: triphosphoribosyl-dephospho-CoA synthase [Thaumarchaeota archaeon]|nr:triphosphoribosyl-dephospho-CoA synthase [Candidatus Geocrenenecus arthurdayi]MCL7390611.1 triphosphoribosyl-dephospho-CoA synthase [Candidatus Geocrenenecus arthurdayi]MCL7395864.1 triphosphoribosyl-dephospho-CoA synthase [Candidatus Geocrenenecus arthurdayi]MCL7403318.1 triphosphoribosyl-dephospho-CoA synthase [Candidatus Geocrenenecus arthurdayi]